MCPTPDPRPHALEQSARALAALLPTRDAARRWFEACVAAWGPRAVVDSAEQGQIRKVTRRRAGGQDLLVGPSLAWNLAGRQTSAGFEPLQALEVHHGRQSITLRYSEEGRHVETSLDDRFPGGLLGLAAALARAQDPLTVSRDLVLGLAEDGHGPARIHCPVPAPGGLEGVWRMGLQGCRRALFDGRVGPMARFVVADGLEGRAVGWGATREEALGAYAAEVERELPSPRHEEHFANDDYDDDGRLLERGSLEGMFGALDPSDGAGVQGPPGLHLEPTYDPVTGATAFETGPIELRGPTSDAAPLPARADAVPHVLVPLDDPPHAPAPGTRWVRLLGELGRTRHALRLKDGDGFVLVGSDLLGHVNLASLRRDLDRLDAEEDARGPGYVSPFAAFARFRARLYRWAPARDGRPEGLVPCGGETGPRFDAGGIDGDQAQAQVRRQQRIRRA